MTNHWKTVGSESQIHQRSPVSVYFLSKPLTCLFAIWYLGQKLSNQINGRKTSTLGWGRKDFTIWLVWIDQGFWYGISNSLFWSSEFQSFQIIVVQYKKGGLYSFKLSTYKASKTASSKILRSITRLFYI